MYVKVFYCIIKQPTDTYIYCIRINSTSFPLPSSLFPLPSFLFFFPPHSLSVLQGISYPPYGSVGYLDQLRNRETTWEFLLVRGDVGIECSMDTNYFPTEPASAVYLSSNSNKQALGRSNSCCCLYIWFWSWNHVIMSMLLQFPLLLF